MKELQFSKDNKILTTAGKGVFSSAVENPSSYKRETKTSDKPW